MTDQPVLDAAALARLADGTGSPEEATLARAQKQAAYDGPPPTTTPRNGVEAAQRLQYLTEGKDPVWLARWSAGHAETMREYHSLAKMKAEADPVDLAMAGVLPSHLEFEARTPGVASVREMASMIPHLRDEGGMSDEAIAHFLRDGPADAMDYSIAVNFRKTVAETPELRARWLAGDPTLKSQMIRAAVLVTAGPGVAGKK
jgi:hypothetical protein